MVRTTNLRTYPATLVFLLAALCRAIVERIILI